MTAPLTVYKDRGSGDWHWDCRGHPTAVRAARSHLSQHARFGFRQ